VNKKEYYYYSTGEVKIININDEIITHYFVEGKIEKETKNGKIWNGLMIKWYENGQKKSEETYKNGKRDGLSTLWFDNGQKKEEGTYKYGEKDGLWTYVYKNPYKKIEGTYKYGEKDGLWTYWDYDDQTKYEGKMISEDRYYSYLYIKSDGTFLIWDGYENNIVYHTTYKNGKEHGISTLWGDDGSKYEVKFNRGIEGRYKILKPPD